ncbi:hypothetical protein [Shewanella sedimentimangrovi]|uniref:Uncharacterized protein n=1 Tax=Shewanella sedimentimangrovi TaxID=2814293 RepID=A0ABX7QZX5_9GAMM|nr:hypothetical protein [Shewanella sedimentimangrovi]QSX37098.1 hypothetical protein JYB85_17880 [Shewanella sedimentimangrovi]
MRVSLNNGIRVEDESAIYTWDLNFKIDGAGNFIQPINCSEFELMVGEIYGNEFVRVVQQAKSIAFGDIGDIRSVAQIEAVLDKVNEIIVSETNRVTDTFFYNDSVEYISKRLNFKNIECNCRRKWSLENEDLIVDVVIINALLNTQIK